MVRSTTRNRQREAATAPQEPAQEQVQAPTRTRGGHRGTRGAAPDNPPSGGTSGTRITGQTDVSSQESDLIPEGNATPAAGTAVAAQAPPEQRQLGGVNARNAFESYGQQMQLSTIVGTLIKFNKGDWVTGDDEDLEEESEFVVNMDQLLVGWIKWIDQKPSEQIMGPVGEGFQPPRRNELGDLDQGEWEVDEQGRPRDPWQFSNQVVLKDPGQDASSDNLYTFATSSKGGLGALGALCKIYGKEMRQRPDDYPIVRLDSDYYTHPQFGRTYVPVFPVVGWEPKAQFAEVTEVTTTPAAQPRGPRRDQEPEPETAAPARSQGRRGRRAA